jgi:hypothetical protein
MNKMSLYLFLALAYLGLSKSFSPAEQATPYVEDEHSLIQFFPEAPISVILTESFQTGFLIQTYYHRYHAVYIFKESQEIVVRTSESYWRKHLPHLGLSLLRRNDTEPVRESTVPAPPGANFIGNPAYGSWENLSGGQRVWTFHNAYKNLPEIFNWGDFQPTYEFYQTLSSHLEHEAVFLGLRREFGTEGSISKEFLASTQVRGRRFHFSSDSTLMRIFGENSWINKFFSPRVAPQETSLDSPKSNSLEESKSEVDSMLGERPINKVDKEEPEPSIFFLDNLDDQDTFNE